MTTGTVNTMRRRRFLGIASTTALLSLPSAWSAPSHAYTNLMPQFWDLYDSALHERIQVRVESILHGFFTPNALIYEGAGVKWSAAGIARWLKDFDPIADSVRALSLTVPATIRAQPPRFQANLPEFDANAGRIYFLPSLFWFDGHRQPWRGAYPLFVGVDGIVHYHGNDCDLTVFIDHELLHVFHAQRNPAMLLDESPPIFIDLWTERLAVYASRILNPAADRLHILLDDQPLAAATADAVTYAAGELLKCLDSTDSKDEQRFFSTGYVGDLPARSGYLVGWKVAERVGRSMSLTALASLNQSAVRERVAHELAAIAEGR